MKLKFRHYFFMAMILTPVLGSAKPVIVLDAAHGGSDPGAKAGSEVEKDWNYKFATALQKALEGAGFDVLQIRKKDETLSLEKRVERINTSQASAVLVIHAEREWTGNHKGPMIVVEPPTQGGEFTELSRWGAITPYQYRTSLKLARDIALSLGLGNELSDLSDSRGLAGETTSGTSRLYCLPHQNLRYLTIPAVVLTPLFISSPSDVRKFSQDEEVADFTAKVVRGLTDFLQ